jgi:acetyl-CoA acetyltransferase
MTYSLRNKAAVVGLGVTEFSKSSGRSEMQLAMEAVTMALADAGLEPSDLDGLCTYTLDNNSEVEILRNIGAPNLKFFSRISFGGGGACAPLMQAAMAVALGLAGCVVCYRAMNERSGTRFGQPNAYSLPQSEILLHDFHIMHGIMVAATMMAIPMRRYMYETGATSEDFCNYSLAVRRHAATNPAAFFYRKPITREDYMHSRMISDPFRLLDCCQESDGAVAVAVTTPERARSLRQKPVLIRAAAQGAPNGSLLCTSYYKNDIVPREESELVAEQLYQMAGIGPMDIQIAIIYDHFGPTVLPALEGYGFCKRGEAKDFIKNGNIEIGGTLPVNTHGGQLGEAYIHGMNGIAEGVRQLRGTAVNQVPSVEHVLVTAGTGLPTSGLILSKS